LGRCGSPCCGVHGHIADSVRLGGAVRWTVSFHGRPRTGAAGVRSALTCVAESSLHSPCARPCPCDVPGGGRPGKGRRPDDWGGGSGERDACGAGGAGAVARSFVDGVLGRGCRGAAGELFGNSVRHGGSGLPGQTVTVGEGLVRVEVTDRGGPGVPRLLPVGGDAEGVPHVRPEEW